MGADHPRARHKGQLSSGWLLAANALVQFSIGAPKQWSLLVHVFTGREHPRYQQS
jgi:hypothetical protein